MKYIKKYIIIFMNPFEALKIGQYFKKKQMWGNGL